MKSLFAKILVLFIAITTANTSKSNEISPLMKLTPSGISLPRTKFTDGKNAVDLSSYQGSYLLINFWATWCAPCIREMPALDNLANLLRENNLTILAISQDTGGPAEVQSFLTKLDLKNLKVLYDPGKKASRDFGIRGLPTTVLISPQGLILARLEGEARWDQLPLVNQIKEIIKAK